MTDLDAQIASLAKQLSALRKQRAELVKQARRTHTRKTVTVQERTAQIQQMLAERVALTTLIQELRGQTARYPEFKQAVLQRRQVTVMIGRRSRMLK